MGVPEARALRREAVARGRHRAQQRRGCLAYLIEFSGMRTVWLPDLMCGPVPALFRREGVKVRTYPVGRGLSPGFGAFRVGGGGAAHGLLLPGPCGRLRDGTRRELRQANSQRGAGLLQGPVARGRHGLQVPKVFRGFRRRLPRDARRGEKRPGGGLIAAPVYVPILWSDVERGSGKWTLRYAEGIPPLPVDQRYAEEEMERKMEVFGKCMS